MSAQRADQLARMRHWAFATAVWLAVGFSLGWYYTFTYYGKEGWPMPLPEPCAAILLYYFSVLNIPTPGQAVHWMLVFPLAGALWAGLLWRLARIGGVEPPALHRVAAAFALAAAPLALPAPWMAWVAGQTDAGFAWDRMIAVALRRGIVPPWGWLSPMYLALGLTALALQLAAYRRLFPCRPLAAARHYLAALVVLVVVSAVGAALVAYPLRLWLEP